MKITYAEKQVWTKDISSDPLADFGSGAKKIKKAWSEATDRGITANFMEVNQSFVDWFQPLYEKSMLGKKNPAVRDVYATTIGRDEIPFPYQGFQLFDNGEQVGGAVFTLREDRLSIVYRAFLPDWINQTSKLRCSPALYGEYLLTLHALENDKHKIVHGMDRNLYGINTSIGVAIFKLSVGCIPVTQKEPVVAEIDTETISEDTLIFEYSAPASPITQAYLVTSTDQQHRYQQLLSYSDRINIVVLNNSETNTI